DGACAHNDTQPPAHAADSDQTDCKDDSPRRATDGRLAGLEARGHEDVAELLQRQAAEVVLREVEPGLADRQELIHDAVVVERMDILDELLDRSVQLHATRLRGSLTSGHAMTSRSVPTRPT